MAWADLEKRFHFRGDHAALCLGRQKFGNIGAQPGCAEDHILIQTSQIVRPQAQFGPQTLQFLRQAAEILAAILIAGGNADSCPQQHFNKRRVGYADADHSHCFPLEPGQIFFERHLHCRSPF